MPKVGPFLARFRRVGTKAIAAASSSGYAVSNLDNGEDPSGDMDAGEQIGSEAWRGSFGKQSGSHELESRSVLRWRAIEVKAKGLRFSERQPAKKDGDVVWEVARKIAQGICWYSGFHLNQCVEHSGHRVPLIELIRCEFNWIVIVGVSLRKGLPAIRHLDQIGHQRLSICCDGSKCAPRRQSRSSLSTQLLIW